MTMAPVLSVSHLSKTYCKDLRRSLRYGLADMLREVAGPLGRREVLRRGEFLALDDVSLSLAPGQALAVLGHNGAGKSTLLKILNGLLKPNGGEVRIAGSVGALIELGTGLNPLLSGRENILVAAAIHGFPRDRERDLVEEVVDFSGLEAVIDSPFQTYSSGMKARLAFSLVALMRPDLLLIDEVLAVGDHEFQRKCVAYLLGYLRTGGSLLFVSHNGHQVQAVCRDAVLLEQGRLVFAGPAGEALHRMYERRPAAAIEARSESRATGPVAIESLSAIAPDGRPARTGEPLDLRLVYRSDEAVDATWAVTIWSADGWVCVTSAVDDRPRRLDPGTGTLTCTIPRLPLVAGRYLLSASIVDPATLHPIDRFGQERGAVLDVTSPPGLIANLQRQRGQLVEMDVVWP